MGEFRRPKAQRTWMFDVTFLESNWTCIFGNGCQGVLTGPTPELVQGCCSYGAHFTDEKDRRAWRRREAPDRRPVAVQIQGQHRVPRASRRTARSVTRLVKDACIFLNRPGLSPGAGCALHVMAMDNDESYIPSKPEVCWQLPLRRDDEVLDDGHVITRISQWDRRTGARAVPSSTGGAPSQRPRLRRASSRRRFDGRRTRSDGRPDCL